MENTTLVDILANTDVLVTFDLDLGSKFPCVSMGHQKVILTWGKIKKKYLIMRRMSYDWAWSLDQKSHSELYS